MAQGEHNHVWDILLKVNPGSKHTGRETLEIYKQCNCGAINKTEALVTHEDGSLIETQGY